MCDNSARKMATCRKDVCVCLCACVCVCECVCVCVCVCAGEYKVSCHTDTYTTYVQALQRMKRKSAITCRCLLDKVVGRFVDRLSLAATDILLHLG